MNMENVNTLGQTPEDLKKLAEERLKQAEDLLLIAKANKEEAEARNDADAIALAESRLDQAEAAVENAKQNLEV